MITMNGQSRVLWHPIKPGEYGVAEMPASEVCSHMGIAGKYMLFRLLPRNGKPFNPADPQTCPLMVQLYDLDGIGFSSPITTGEAGLFYLDPDRSALDHGRGEGCTHYYYPHGYRDMHDGDNLLAASEEPKEY